MSSDGDTIGTDGRVLPSASQIAQRGADRRTPSEKAALRAAPTHTSACAKCSWRRDGLTLKQARAAWREHAAEAHPQDFTGGKGHRMPDALRDRALELVRQGGKSYAAIAQEVGVASASTVRRWALDAGLA